MLGLNQYMFGLNRYILRQCLSGMIFVTGALTAAVWLAQSLRLVDLIVNRGLSAEVFLYLAMLILPRFLDIVIPIGTFIAVLFVFNRLTTESELVVMRAAGMSPMALAKPVLELAAIAWFILMLLSVYLLPALESYGSRTCSSRSATALFRACCRKARSRRSRTS